MSAVFVDWVTCFERHSVEEPLPILVDEIVVAYDRDGLARRELLRPTAVAGSWDTSLRLRCDGHSVALSGNWGRFSRRDNVFGFGIAETFRRGNDVLSGLGLPGFTTTRRVAGDEARAGASLSRLDLTCNFSAGSDSRARAVIRWLGTRSVARVKRGLVGDESVWWANTRYMFKAYLKAAELVAHGCTDQRLIQWAHDMGIVRIEVELKRRLLDELEMRDPRDISDDRLVEVFRERTEILRSMPADHADEADLLHAVPTKTRTILAAWLAGHDVKTLVSRATLFRHAKTLREYGIDILSERDVRVMPVRVRTIELREAEPPDWYEFEDYA